MKALKPVGLALVVSLSLQCSAASQAPSSDVSLTVTADAAGWAPSGQSIAYSNGAQFVVVNFEDGARERCRITVPAVIPPIQQIQWSPDGDQIAFLATREKDRWYTIWLSTPDCSEPRDILPLGSGPESPGIRALALSTWKDSRTLAFVHHCGPGCHTLNTINVDDASQNRFCAGEGAFHWNRAKTHAAVELHLGGLGIVSDSPSPAEADVLRCTQRVPGCRVVQGQAMGTMHQFEDWNPDGRRALVTRISCGQTEKGQSPELALWDTTTSNVTAAVKGAATRGSFSPDGKRIAYIGLEAANRDKSANNTDTGSVNLSVAIANAGDYRIERVIPIGAMVLREFEGPFDGLERHPGEFRPSWSSDSQHLLIRDAKRNLSIVDASSDSRPLSLGDVEATWASSGRRLAIIDQASHSLRVMEVR